MKNDLFSHNILAQHLHPITLLHCSACRSRSVIMSASAEEDSLMKWGSKQGHILTGGGILESRSKPGVDFTEEHLPHYLLKQKIVRQTMRKWLDQNIRSHSIVGAWGRPLFSGGWMESTDGDTESFNLQTPSIFIDMRIPVARPTLRVRMRQNLSECSDYELRMLGRQHCFSGYSYLEAPAKDGAPVFTRYHIIDWNYHPAYPRSRPNRWWIETKAAGKDGNGAAGATESFKEFSVIRDKYNVPVYMERWARREPQRDQHTKYLALRKVRTCPAILKTQGRAPERDAVLVVVGQHWCLALDRDYTSLEQYMLHLQVLQQKKDYVAPAALGGGPVFVDNLLAVDDKYGDYALRRKAAEDYVSLEGSYGILPDHVLTGAAGGASATGSANSGTGGGNHANKTTTSNFLIQRSTQPWLEGTALPLQDITLYFDKTMAVLRSIFCGAQGRLSGEWEVLECSFDQKDLQRMFMTAGQGRILSKL